MADWTLPQLSDLKVDVLNMLKLRDVDAVTLAEAPTSPPVGAVRWNRTTKTFQSWDGAVWQTMVIAMVGGGTGAQTPGEILAGLGLGTMSTQNSNAVAISGGSITGLSNLGSSGNITALGVYVAGSGGVALTNSVGYVREVAIDNIANIAHINQNESISGSWTFNGPATFNGAVVVNSQPTFNPSIHIAGTSPAVWFSDTDAAGTERNTIIFALAEEFSIRSYNDGFGTSAPLLTATRTNLTWTGTNTYGVWTFNNTVNVSGATDTAANIFVKGPGGAGIQFWAAGVAQAKVFGTAGGNLYNDCEVNYWRTLNGATLRASLNSVGAFTSGATICAGNGHYLNPQGNYAYYAWGGNIQIFGTTYSLTNYANTQVFAQFTDAGLFKLELPASVVCIGGAPGIGFRLYKQSGACFMCGPNAGSSFEWYTGDGSTQLMTLGTANGGTLRPIGGIQLNNGTGDIPALRFFNEPTSGIYYNPTGSGSNPTIEFGSRFNNAGRAIMRALVGASAVDFVCGSAFPMMLVSGLVHIGRSGYHTDLQNFGHIYPSTNLVYQCGVSYQAWLAVHSQSFVTISDARMKDRHGRIENSLDLLDEIEPFIGSFKEEFKPVEDEDNTHKIKDWTKKFPTFSAQEVAAKIDSKYGTRITEHDEEHDTWGIDYSKLTPLLWQMIHDLRDRVKALEP